METTILPPLHAYSRKKTAKRKCWNILTISSNSSPPVTNSKTIYNFVWLDKTYTIKQIKVNMCILKQWTNHIRLKEVILIVVTKKPLLYLMEANNARMPDNLHYRYLLFDLEITSRKLAEKNLIIIFLDK